jgi:DNA-binding beta-propeller fold protein YncE
MNFFPLGIARDGAGNAFFADGEGAAARFDSPQGVAADKDGKVHVADYGNQAIRSVDSTGRVTTMELSG